MRNWHSENYPTVGDNGLLTILFNNDIGAVTGWSAIQGVRNNYCSLMYTVMSLRRCVKLFHRFQNRFSKGFIKESPAVILLFTVLQRSFIGIELFIKNAL